MTNAAVEKLELDLSESFQEAVSVTLHSEVNDDGAAIAIFDMKYCPKSSRSNSRPHAVRQTALQCEAPDLNLPRFSLYPKSISIFNLITRWLKVSQEVDFADSSEFSRRYRLHSGVEEAARTLFNSDIREYFGKHPGWTVRGERSRLVVFIHRKVCAPDALDAFANDARAICAQFRSAERKLDAQPEVRREMNRQDVTAAADKAGGLVGAVMRKQLRENVLSPGELQTFLDGKPPRNVSPGLRRQTIGGAYLPLFVGALLLIGGAVVGGAIALANEGVPRTIGLLFLILFPVLGGGILFFTTRYRSRKLRTLRDGALVEGLISEVHRTNVQINGRMRWLAFVKYQHQGTDYTACQNIYDPAVAPARRFASDKHPVRILVDPADPEHILCMDLLTDLD